MDENHKNKEASMGASLFFNIINHCSADAAIALTGLLRSKHIFTATSRSTMAKNCRSVNRNPIIVIR
jgi:hypothetical protein